MWHRRPSPPPPSPLASLCEAMREVAKPSVHLCVPRSSRSLSPSDRQPRNVPLIRCYSDREEVKPNPTPRLERANSISGSRSSLPLCPDLSPSQVLAIKRSWRHINTKGLATVIRRCFQRLESSSQSAAAAFQLPPAQSGVAVRSVSDHTKFFLAFLQRIVDGEPDLELELKRIGAKHAFLDEECGVGVRDIERLGELFVEVLLRLDGIKQSKETTRAWRRLLAEILHHFRDGFDAELRFQKRRSSFQPGVRRNSMPNSNRKTSLKVDASSVTRKLSNF